MTHPGVGPITALETETFGGEPKRFVDGKAVASYVGLIPSGHSSAGRQRLGGLSKQGNPLLRFSGSVFDLCKSHHAPFRFLPAEDVGDRFFSLSYC